MENFIELHFKAEQLIPYGLPDIGYPIPIMMVEGILANSGQLPLEFMLYGLQYITSKGASNWQELETALERLSNLLAPEDDREIVAAAGEDWWLEIGPVDLDAKIITIQRKGFLIAAIQPREDKRLRVAGYRPLDGKSAEMLIAMSQNPHPQYGVCMRENNWEYALDNSATMGNFYANERGEVYLSYWENGLGLFLDGSESAVWIKQKNSIPRLVALVATELGLNYALSGCEEPYEDDIEHD